MGKNTENKEMTGILMWDLSAVFDCLDWNILCSKLHIYGYDKLSKNGSDHSCQNTHKGLTSRIACQVNKI
jgi:hypothetical protein